MKWKIEYSETPWDQYWDITKEGDERLFRSYTKEDAEWLCDILNLLKAE